MIKKILIVSIILLLEACGGTKNFVDQDAEIDSQLDRSEEEILSVSYWPRASSSDHSIAPFLP